MKSSSATGINRPMRKVTGLGDCNNFFVSCERSVDRSLEGRPVVVLSNNDGCVVARSNEAKRIGIKMGQPAFEIKDLIRNRSVIALSGNHLLYREISIKVHDIFRRFVPEAIDYSVDESFFDMTGIPESALKEIGEAIVSACWEEAHIPVTVGFSYSKTLAKIVAETCKKAGRPVGVMLDEEELLEVMSRLPISELWGVGRRLTKRLYESGIYTIADFARRDLTWVRSKMGVNGERSWRELHGESCIELEHVSRLLQDSVSESRTFPEDVDDYDYVRARIAIYAADCARKLRAMRGVCRRVGVTLSSNRFHTEKGYLSPHLEMELPARTSETTAIVSTAITLLDNIWVEGVWFKRAGVWLAEITPDIPETPSLFDEVVKSADCRKAGRNLHDRIDAINGDVGHCVIRLASQLTQGHPGHNDGYSSSFGAPFQVPKTDTKSGGQKNDTPSHKKHQK